MHNGKSNATEACCQWVAGFSKDSWKRKHKCRDGRLYNADAHRASCAQRGSTAFLQRSKVPLWPRGRLYSARLLLHQWLRFQRDTWAVCMACPGCSSLTTDHTLFPAEGCWPHSSSWEQRDLNYLGLSWIKEASIAATYDGKHKLHTIWGWEHMACSIYTYLPEHINFCLVCLGSVDCCNVLKTDLGRTQTQIILIKGNRGSIIRDQLSWAGSCIVPWDSKERHKKIEIRSNK